MNFFILGFFTGMSLIFAVGAQNIFVIEQGLKKNFTFLVCFICAVSDFLLIFLGIFLFHYFNVFFTPVVELFFNVMLLIFLIHFIWSKVKTISKNIELKEIDKKYDFFKVIYRTLGFTYLNPHVYSDTVFFLGNFSKDFFIIQKIFFGFGASLASIIFFFLLGYLSKYLSRHIKNYKMWNVINLFIIGFMSMLVFYVLQNIFE